MSNNPVIEIPALGDFSTARKRAVVAALMKALETGKIAIRRYPYIDKVDQFKVVGCVMSSQVIDQGNAIDYVVNYIFNEERLVNGQWMGGEEPITVVTRKRVKKQDESVPV